MKENYYSLWYCVIYLFRTLVVLPLLPILIVSLLSVSCNDEKSSQPDLLYTISGRLSIDNGNSSGTEVMVDDFINWKTVTDSTGYFEIKGVSGGAHTLKALKQNDDGSFSKIEKKLNVVSNLNLEVLKLPKPLLLFSPTDIYAGSMKLKWAKSDADDFYEYKLYKHTNAGLDETTGELVFVSVAKSDTTFVVSGLNPRKEYYFRVFQMNEYGRIGGSNIVHSTTTDSNLISNGSFELTNDLTQNWNIQVGHSNNVIRLTDSIKYDGDKAVFTSYTGAGQYISPIMESKNSFRLEINRNYELSLMVRVDGKRGNTDDMFLNIYQGTEYIGTIYVNPPADPNTRYVFMDWTRFSKVIMVTNNTPISLTFIFCNAGLWIDKIELKPLD